MATAKWHIHQDAGVLTLARRLPARFDVSAETVLAHGSSKRIAHQVRQDMWRALQNLRGFAPVVQVSEIAEGLAVRAGGAVAGRFNQSQVEAEISEVLEDPTRRARWQRFASAGGRHV